MLYVYKSIKNFTTQHLIDVRQAAYRQRLEYMIVRGLREKYSV